MTFLAIDIGNTRLKWALHTDPHRAAPLLAQGAEFLENIDRLAEGDWAGLAPPSRMLGCTVAGDAVKRRVETVKLVAALVIEHARLQARHGVQQCHCRDFATRKNEIPQAQLLINLSIHKSLVNAFISTTYEYGTPATSPPLDLILLQALSMGREKHHWRIVEAVRSDVGQTTMQGLGHHDHARATTKRPVVDPTVAPLRKVSGIGKLHANLTRRERTPGYSCDQERCEHFGKQSYNVEPHAAYDQ